MFTCSVCGKEFQPWSLAFQERKGGKDICRDCKTMMKQSRSVQHANRKTDTLYSALENRVHSLEKDKEMASFIIETAVKGEAANLDWESIISPMLEPMVEERLRPMTKELESMQRQLLAMHKRMKELVEKRIWGDD